MCSDGEPDPLSSNECIEWHDQRIGKRTKDAKRLGIPLLMSEFGACMGTYACEIEIQNVADVADKYLVGWAYWEYKPFHDLTTSAGNKSEGFYELDGTLQVRKVRALSRPYVKAAQGTIKNVTFVTEQPLFLATNFTTIIDIDGSIEAPTLIHAVKDCDETDTCWYPEGYRVVIEPSDFEHEQIISGNTLSIMCSNPHF